jgi:hypothetical protein
MKTPRTEAVVRMAVGPMREYAIIEHAQNLELENEKLRALLEKVYNTPVDCPCEVSNETMNLFDEIRLALS